MIGIKKDWFCGECKLSEMIAEGLILSKIKDGYKCLNVLSVYNSGDLSKMVRVLNNWDSLDENSLIIGGDFNIRTGNLRNVGVEEGDGGRRRNSKDEKISNEGRDFIEVTENKGWIILNGWEVGDERGEYTYVGARGHSVIDYVIVNEWCLNNVISFKVESRVDSDHLPLGLRLRVGTDMVRRKGGAQEDVMYKDLIQWNEESVALYRHKLEQSVDLMMTGNSVEEEWKYLKNKAHEAMQKKRIRVKKWKLGHKKWWDRDCSKAKRAAKNAYLGWRRGLQNKSHYIRKRRFWRQMCWDKEREAKKTEEAALRSLKSETEVWKFLNKSRTTRLVKDNDIGLGEWKRHFRALLLLGRW